jgi:hypothetical protein
MAVQVCLSALPEMTVAISYTYFGFKNRHMQEEAEPIPIEHHHRRNYHDQPVSEAHFTSAEQYVGFQRRN